ncbi:MAG TPA: tetratricopeptide repeat protein [Pyrinomonadaceae bacterium]
MKKVLSVFTLLLALGLFCAAAHDARAQEGGEAKESEKAGTKDPQRPGAKDQTQAPTAAQQPGVEKKTVPTAQPVSAPSAARRESPSRKLFSRKASGTTANVGQGNVGDAASLYKAGMAHYESKRYKEAIESFKGALKLRPGDAEIHYRLGMAYYNTSAYKLAEEEFKQAVRLKPDWAEARFRLGWMAYVLGRTDDAREQYNVLQKLNPEQAQVLYRIIKVDGTGVSDGIQAEAKPVANRASNGDPTVESRLVVPDNQPPANRSSGATPNEKPAAKQPAPVETKTANRPAPTPSPTESSVPPKNSTGAANSTTTPANQKAAKPDAAPKPGEAKPVEPAAKPESAEAPKAEEIPPTNVYKVGVGDVLDIRLSNTPPARSTLFTVMEGGIIEYPLAGGPLKVGGLTTEEINARIKGELKRRAVGGDDNRQEVFVSVREYSSHTIVVTGLVNSPGPRVLHREAVPLYVVLAEAQPRADAGRAVVMRAGAQIPIDLADTAQLSTLVRAGDVITVQSRPAQFYYIGGKVHMPGQKPFQPGITLTQAILAAGGVENSKVDKISVSREGQEGRLSTTQYKLKEIRLGVTPDPRVQPGDRIEVGLGRQTITK